MPLQRSHCSVDFFTKTVAVEKQILCVAFTPTSEISWLKLDLYRDGKPVWTVVAYLVGNLRRQSQLHGRRVLSS